MGVAAERSSSKNADRAGSNAPPGQNNRSSLFALLVICGEVGVVVGPLLGSFLLNTGFDTSLLAAAAVFTVMAVVFWLFLPKNAHTTKTPVELTGRVPPSDLWSCLKDKKFIGFAAFFSVNLVATNQLYFGLPVELERSGGAGASSLALVFAYASVLTITLQWPIASLMRKAGPTIALPPRFRLAVPRLRFIGSSGDFSPPPNWLPILPALVLVTGTALGNMCVLPVAMGLVLEFAGGRLPARTMACWQALEAWRLSWATQPLPPLYELAYTPSATALAPWIFLSALGGPSRLRSSGFSSPASSVHHSLRQDLHAAQGGATPQR